jgi:hypothetical protein
MAQEPKYETLIEVLDEVERMERAADNKYTHAVQVLTPIQLLEQVDQLVESNARLSRPIIFRRALRLYLKVMKQAGRLDFKHRARRRIA